MSADDLPTCEFSERRLLRDWLESNHNVSRGIFIRVFKKASGVPGVTFEEILDEGLCFGWSESKRLPLDEVSYLQRFTPRKTIGTTSRRNVEHARALMANGLMTDAGLKSLGGAISS